ncbi:Retrovirus-related Pol polyprotein from transposon opus [Nosema granulosis]|uniref:Retrovirus-related Pol polyprotein from transposon opus n=1 Tax=Nosema granulosis TaxID=83296 RepID=A0A9P6GZL9_9MICR|nr:Retrovirus-related Pol polyprotein from transposon opus [Nosema granulosis]
MKKNEEILISNSLVKKLKSKMKIPIECTIETNNKGTVSWSRPIKSLKDKEDFQESILDLERRNIVEESKSLWLNPVQLVRKKNGKLRFCIDLRRVNDLVDQDCFEIPRIQELLSSLHGKKLFTGIDLEDGFFQIPIKESDREKTTFYTGKRLMQFKRMPQGFKNSPAIFQRVMHLVLKDLIGTCCLVYIDDILVFVKDRKEHDENLKKVLERIEEYGLKENTEKRAECQERIKFLGYEIGHDEVKPSLNRAQGIIDYQIPKTKKELQRFLGMINYDRLFIKDLSSMLKPLYALTGKEAKFTMGKIEKDIFFKIKDQWSKNLSLIIPDPKKPFTLETDASNVGIGGVLRQEGKPVAYVSRILNKAEQNYGITEKETLAALWAMEKLQYLLLGNRFTLITDHFATEQIKSKIDFGSSRIQRWFHRFERFNFDIEYRKGETLVVSDALNRALYISKDGVAKRVSKGDSIMEYHKKKESSKSY